MITSLEVADELSHLKTGGQAAVAELFEQYREKLARMVRVRLDTRLLGKVDVDDVLQDAYMEASRRIDAFLERPAVPFYVWIRHLVSQILIDLHRRYRGAQMRNVSREVSLNHWEAASTWDGSLCHLLADSLTSPSEFAVRNELLGQLRGALQDLAAIDREVLILRHLEELSNKEVAEILGVDRFAASKRYIRALGRLRSAMLDRETAQAGV